LTVKRYSTAIDSPKVMNWEAIHDAISKQDVERLTELLSGRKRPMWNDFFASTSSSCQDEEHDKDVAVRSPPRSLPFLHMAASADDTEKAVAMMKILLNSGMDVNVLDSDGKTALIYLVERSTQVVYDQVDFLLEEGIDVNIRGKKNDETAFFIVWRRRRKVLEDADRLGEKYYAAANQQDERLSELARLLLEDDGHDLCAVDSSGRTPIMLICADGSFSYRIQDLLRGILKDMDKTKRSKCLHQLDDKGKSALMYTMERRLPMDIARVLLQNFATDPLVGDPQGVYAFFGLLRNGFNTSIFCSSDDFGLGKQESKWDRIFELINHLVERGCNPKAKDELGQTAFHIVAQNSKLSAKAGPNLKRLVDCLSKWGVGVYRNGVSIFMLPIRMVGRHSCWYVVEREPMIGEVMIPGRRFGSS